MLRRLHLRDVVIVDELEVELAAGFTVLTGETGAGKSILIDALQLALGQRADAGIVREGAARAEISAEFDSPAALLPWLDDAGFATDASSDRSSGRSSGSSLLLRRTVDAQGKSRAWINGSPATVTQLREVAEHLVDIHGQHAWQSLTRPAAVRALLDAQAGVEGPPMQALTLSWQSWRNCLAALDDARSRRDTLERERERLAWQITELAKLNPAADEWQQINAEHQRLAHGQALLDACHAALQALADGEQPAELLTHRAIDALDAVAHVDMDLQSVADVLRSAAAQIEDAAHTLHTYLGRSEPDPNRLAALDARLGDWVALARRYRRPPAELPELLAGWKQELAALDAAADLDGLQAAASLAEANWRKAATQVGRLRKKAAPLLAQAVTQAMQQLGMAGGQFEVALVAQEAPASHGLENVEFRVAGHAGSTPRPLAKVASGGELSRLALAIAVSTLQGTAQGMAQGMAQGTGQVTAQGAPGNSTIPTLIFDEIDAGVGGTVADSVGRLMKQLGQSCQVLAVTHLAQVAACADGHLLVSKTLRGAQTVSAIQSISGEARVAEVSRMLGGERLAGTSRAHAQALLGVPAAGGST